LSLLIGYFLLKLSRIEISEIPELRDSKAASEDVLASCLEVRVVAASDRMVVHIEMPSEKSSAIGSMAQESSSPTSSHGNTV